MFTHYNQYASTNQSVFGMPARSVYVLDLFGVVAVPSPVVDTDQLGKHELTLKDSEKISPKTEETRRAVAQMIADVKKNSQIENFNNGEISFVHPDGDKFIQVTEDVNGIFYIDSKGNIAAKLSNLERGKIYLFEAVDATGNKYKYTFSVDNNGTILLQQKGDVNLTL